MADERPAKPMPTDADDASEAIDRPEASAETTPDAAPDSDSGTDRPVAPDDGVFDEVAGVLERVDELVSEVVERASPPDPELNDFLSPAAIDAAVEEEMSMPADDVGLGHDLVEADSIEEIDSILADGAAAALEAARDAHEGIEPDPAIERDDEHEHASPLEGSAVAHDDLDLALAAGTTPDHANENIEDLDALVADGVAQGLDPPPEQPWDRESHEHTPPAPPKRDLTTAETNAFGKALDDALAHADAEPEDEHESTASIIAGGDADADPPGRYLETPKPIDPSALDVEFDAEVDDIFDAELEAAFLAAAEAEGRDRPEMPLEQIDQIDEPPRSTASVEPPPPTPESTLVEDDEPRTSASVESDGVAEDRLRETDDGGGDPVEAPDAAKSAARPAVMFETPPAPDNAATARSADDPEAATRDDGNELRSESVENDGSTPEPEPAATDTAEADLEEDEELPEPIVDKLRRALVPWQTRGFRVIEGCAAPMELMPASARLPIDLVAITLVIWVPIVWALALFASPEPRSNAPSVFDRSAAISAAEHGDAGDAPDSTPNTPDVPDGSDLRRSSSANIADAHAHVDESGH